MSPISFPPPQLLQPYYYFEGIQKKPEVVRTSSFMDRATFKEMTS